LDLLVAWRGKVRPVEIKRPGHEGELTDGERRAIDELARRGVEAIVAAQVEDVIEQW
jgi:hypothetical protein